MTTYDMMPDGVGATGYGVVTTQGTNDLFEVTNMAFGAVTYTNYADDLFGTLQFSGLTALGSSVGTLTFTGIIVPFANSTWGPWGLVSGQPNYMPPITGQLWPRGAIAFGAR